MYADDTTLITSISTTGDNSDETINNELQNFNDWFEIKQIVNKYVSRTITFPNLNFYNKRIEYVYTLIYLGLFLTIILCGKIT